MPIPSFDINRIPQPSQKEVSSKESKAEKSEEQPPVIGGEGSLEGITSLEDSQEEGDEKEKPSFPAASPLMDVQPVYEPEKKVENKQLTREDFEEILNNSKDLPEAIKNLLKQIVKVGPYQDGDIVIRYDLGKDEWVLNEEFVGKSKVEEVLKEIVEGVGDSSQETPPGGGEGKDKEKAQELEVNEGTPLLEDSEKQKEIERLVGKKFIVDEDGQQKVEWEVKGYKDGNVTVTQTVYPDMQIFTDINLSYEGFQNAIRGKKVIERGDKEDVKIESKILEHEQFVKPYVDREVIVFEEGDSKAIWVVEGYNAQDDTVSVSKKVYSDRGIVGGGDIIPFKDFQETVSKDVEDVGENKKESINPLTFEEMPQLLQEVVDEREAYSIVSAAAKEKGGYMHSSGDVFVWDSEEEDGWFSPGGKISRTRMYQFVFMPDIQKALGVQKNVVEGATQEPQSKEAQPSGVEEENVESFNEKLAKVFTMENDFRYKEIETKLPKSLEGERRTKQAKRDFEDTYPEAFEQYKRIKSIFEGMQRIQKIIDSADDKGALAEIKRQKDELKAEWTEIKNNRK